MSGEVSRSFPGPDDDAPYIVRDHPVRAFHPFETDADVARLVVEGMWGPEEVAEYQRRQAIA